MTRFRVEKLIREHPTEEFSCGQEALDRFLRLFALTNQHAKASQTYVALDGARVIGYYTLRSAPWLLTMRRHVSQRGWRATPSRLCSWRVWPARAFYAHFGFVPSPTDPLHLFVLLKDVRRMGETHES